MCFITAKDSGHSLSRFLSLVLRHKPEVIGLTLDQSGWVDVQVLLDACNAHGRKITADSLAKMVAENSKQRFAFSPDGKMIRASQGHSLDVELGLRTAATTGSSISRHCFSLRSINS
jgi:putative RNA 2'-phosphotransferase